MKITDAHWEKRNLGVDTVEFDIADNDNDNENIIQEILGNQKQYNVVRLPVNKPGLMLRLQDNGYLFSECMLSLKHNLDESKIKNAGKKISDISYLHMDDNDLNLLFSEIDKGLFNTDRIYNDTNFTKETAATRYKNWINDERENGSGIYKVLHMNNTIGFFVLKRKDNSVFAQLLCGLYNDFKGKGFGVFMALGAVVESLNQGAKAVTTNVSSNNPASVKVHKSAGYDVTDMRYIFCKHVH